MNVLLNLLMSLSYGIPALVVAGLSLLVMVYALIKMEAGAMVVAALLLVPVTYFAGGWSGIPLVVRLLPLFPLLSAFIISREEPFIAWILPVPAFGYLGYFLFNLVVYNSSSF